jgi:hypothetical protein
MKCKECGREMPTGANDTTIVGWLMVTDTAFCPTCLRLARLEKEVFECQKAIVRASNHLDGLQRTVEEKTVEEKK